MVGKGMGYLPLIALLVGRLLVPGNALAVTVNEPAPDFTLPSAFPQKHLCNRRFNSTIKA
jgi:hypothetical protein